MIANQKMAINKDSTDKVGPKYDQDSGIFLRNLNDNVRNFSGVKVAVLL